MAFYSGDYTSKLEVCCLYALIADTTAWSYLNIDFLISKPYIKTHLQIPPYHHNYVQCTSSKLDFIAILAIHMLMIS